MNHTPRPVGHPSQEGISEQSAGCIRSPLERGGAQRRGVLLHSPTP